MNSIHDDDPSESRRDLRLNSAIVPGTTFSSAILPAVPQKVSVEPTVIREVPAPVFRETGVPNHSAEAEVDVSRYLHSLRRNWLLGGLLGIIAAAPLAFAAWMLIKPTYTAEEYIRIAQSQKSLLFDSGEAAPGRFDFKSYKNTQRQILIQPFALNLALKNPELASMPAIQNHPDPIGWLEKELKVTFPDEAEIMKVSLAHTDPLVAHRIVKAIVDTYMRETVEKETKERSDRLGQLEKVLDDTDKKSRDKRKSLSDLVDALGTGDSLTLNIAQQASLQQLSMLRQELSKTQFELMRAKGELQAQTGGQSRASSESDPSKTKSPEKSAPAPVVTGSAAAVPSTEKGTDAGNSLVQPRIATEVPVAQGDDVFLEEALDRDPIASKLNKEIEQKQAQILQAGQRYEKKVAAPMIQKYQAQLEDSKLKLAERTKRVQRLLAEGSNSNSKGLNPSLNLTENLPIKIAILERQEEKLREEMKSIETESKKFGRSSIDVEMTRKEIDGLDPLVGKMRQEVERTRIEKDSPLRITLYETTGMPQIPANKKRIAITIAAALMGLFGPLGLLMLRDFLRNHVNSAAAINKQTKISVLGSIPRVPSRLMRRLNDPSHKVANQWRHRLSESVNAVTAMVLRKLDNDGHRIILVSSAMPAEGKSTLAEQLARSLAESGHRTLLIDFDLRRPALHRRFGRALEPGLSEVLRQGANLSQTVRQTDSPNLSLLTAGSSPGNLLQEAANGTLESLFKECRDDYELVVVDSSPILPVADGRLVGQFTDGAILTVLQDSSKFPQLVAARQIMEDYGIAAFGCVLTGDTNDTYYHSYGAHPGAPGAVARGVTATRSMSAM